MARVRKGGGACGAQAAHATDSLYAEQDTRKRGRREKKGKRKEEKKYHAQKWIEGKQKTNFFATHSGQGAKRRLRLTILQQQLLHTLQQCATLYEHTSSSALFPAPRLFSLCLGFI